MRGAQAPVGVEGMLAEFTAAGVLLPADVRVALTLGRLCGQVDEPVLLGAALAVRALRLGSVCVDLARVRDTAASQTLLDDDPMVDESAPPVDVQALPWPPRDNWLAACRDSAMVATQPPPPIWRRRPREHARPLYLQGNLLYLDRYAQLEQLMREVLRRRMERHPPPLDPALMRQVLDEVFGTSQTANDQRLAVAAALTGWVTVVAGGPGTGKTTTVGSLLQVVQRLAAWGAPVPRVALAAPTGKAAARLTERMHGRYEAQTIHRLLGARPWRGNRFEHSWQNRLPYDLVVVDETSMVSLELMARLLEALPHECRLVLVGDPDQLASVDAGAVLADLVERPSRRQADGRERLVDLVAPHDLGTADLTAPGPVRRELRRDLVRLRHNHRAEKAIARLAESIRHGDADALVAELRAPATPGEGVVEWLEVDPASGGVMPVLEGVREDVCGAGAEMVRAARRGDATSALRALGRHRLLCAHRSGPYGVAVWSQLARRWIGECLTGDDRQHWAGRDRELVVGQPLLVTENDRVLTLWNGDTGVVVADGDSAIGVFDRGGGEPLSIPVHRLPAVQSPLAMTVHKAQGSEADRVTVVLPPAHSPLLTRELLYTAVTRARHLVRVVGTEQAVRAAAARRVVRASGLRDGWD